MRKGRLHTGGYYGASILDSILQLDPVTQEWRQVGVLQQARQYHAMSVVNITDIQEHCTEY